MRTFTKDEVSWVLHRMLDSIKKGSLDSEGGHWAIEEIYRPMIEALIIESEIEVMVNKRRAEKRDE